MFQRWCTIVIYSTFGKQKRAQESGAHVFFFCWLYSCECVWVILSVVISFMYINENFLDRRLSRISLTLRKKFLLRVDSHMISNDLMILWLEIVFFVCVCVWATEKSNGFWDEEQYQQHLYFLCAVVNSNTKFTFNGRFVCRWCDVHVIRLWCIFFAPDNNNKNIIWRHPPFSCNFIVCILFLSRLNFFP